MLPVAEKHEMEEQRSCTSSIPDLESKTGLMLKGVLKRSHRGLCLPPVTAECLQEAASQIKCIRMGGLSVPHRLGKQRKPEVVAADFLCLVGCRFSHEALH